MLTLATFVNHLNVIAWNPFLPCMAAELGVGVALLGQVPALMMLLATSLGYGAFYVQQHAFSTQQVGWVSLAAWRGVLLGQTAAGGRLGGRPGCLFIIGCIGSGPLIGLSLLLPLPAPAAVVLMAAGWLMHGLIMVSTVILLVGQSPAGRATTLTLYGATMNLGIALGAVLGGFALVRAGYVALGLCTLALPLAAAVLVWGYHPWPGQAPE